MSKDVSLDDIIDFVKQSYRTSVKESFHDSFVKSQSKNLDNQPSDAIPPASDEVFNDSEHARNSNVVVDPRAPAVTKPTISRKSSKATNERDGSLANDLAEAAAPIPETNDESALDSAMKVSSDY